MVTSAVLGVWKRFELPFLILYAAVFYIVVARISLRIANDHSGKLSGLRPGWIPHRLNDLSDAQWRNFRGNLPILTFVFGIFTMVANTLREKCNLKGRGSSFIWLFTSFGYLLYLHGVCVSYIIFIASINYSLVKFFAKSKHFLRIIWIFNLAVLSLNRIYDGYPFSLFGKSFAFLDRYRGTFRWHICFNLVVLRMLSFGCDYHWSHKSSSIDEKEKAINTNAINTNRYSYSMYLCYLIYAPLYIAGPILNFNAFAAQLDVSQENRVGQIAWYSFRWGFNFLLMEALTHFFYYNAFAVSGLWKQLSPFEIFIVGYGVLNFMWLKFLLIWRYFRLWSMMGGIDTPENMPRCINNCYDIESFWKSWHASFNKWLVRYIYIPLGGSQSKLLNIWIIFTFVAVWHDLEWKLISWAWLSCIFLVPVIVIKASIGTFQARSALELFLFRELKTVAGVVTIMSLMLANLAGYVIGPSGINWLISRLLKKDGLPVIGSIFVTLYVGVKLMLHIRDSKERGVFNT